MKQVSLIDVLNVFQKKLCNHVGFYQHGYSIVGVELLGK